MLRRVSYFSTNLMEQMKVREHNLAIIKSKDMLNELDAVQTEMRDLTHNEKYKKKIIQKL